MTTEQELNVPKHIDGCAVGLRVLQVAVEAQLPLGSSCQWAHPSAMLSASHVILHCQEGVLSHVKGLFF